MCIRDRYKRENHIKVDFYSVNTPDEERRSMILFEYNPNDRELYDFYMNQWNIIYNEYSDSLTPDLDRIVGIT